MCPDKELLSAYADNEVESPFKETIATHIESCEKCRESLKAFSVLSANLKDLPIPDFSNDQKAMQSAFDILLRTKKLQTHRNVVRMPVQFLSAAAVFAFVLFLGAYAVLPALNQVQATNYANKLKSSEALSSQMASTIQNVDQNQEPLTLTMTLPESTTLQAFGEVEVLKVSNPPQGQYK